MYDEPEILKYQRRHIGKHGAFLVVENAAHMDLAALAIRRRNPLAWSLQHPEVITSSGSVIEPERRAA